MFLMACGYCGEIPAASCDVHKHLHYIVQDREPVVQDALEVSSSMSWFSGRI